MAEAIRRRFGPNWDENVEPRPRSKELQKKFGFEPRRIVEAAKELLGAGRKA